MVRHSTSEKASDVFAESTSHFGKKVPFEEAFPQVAAMEVEVTEQGNGVPRGAAIRHYSLANNPGEYVNCHNPLCHNGGFSLGEVLREMVERRETVREVHRPCQGNETSPGGGRVYQECASLFKITVHLSYRSSPPAGT